VSTTAFMPRRSSRTRHVTRIVVTFLTTALASLGLLLAGSQTSHASENMVVCYPSLPFSSSGYPVTLGYSTTSPKQAVTGYGYVYIDNCDTKIGSIGFTDPAQVDFQLNSAGYANKINHLGLGTYQVSFSGLGVDGGVAQVTTFGGGHPDQCRIGRWWVSGFDEVVEVSCHSLAGSLVDRPFTASYTNVVKNPGYGFGYLWADQPTTASYTPDPYYQYTTDPAGSPNTIVRTSTGRYQVTMTGVSSPQEDVMVSTYGLADVGARCRVAASVGQSAWVDCDAGGTAVDSMFVLTYVSGGNPLGTPNSPRFLPPANSLPSSYAWVVGNGGTQPSADWSFSTPGTDPWGQTYDPVAGVTTVTVPVGSGVGDVEIVAFGSTTAACDLVGHGDGLGGVPDGIEVQCWDSAGNTIPGVFNLFQIGKLA